MTPFGQTLIVASFALALIGTAAKAWAIRTGSHGAVIVHRRSMVFAAALLSAAFLLLCLMFLAVDTSVLYVWTYTGTWIPWEYRLAGAWTGREGSLLLWTAAMAVVVAILAHRDRRRPDADDAETTARDWTQFIMAGLLVVFLVAVVRQGTFVPTDAFLLAGRPQGNGINPTLISPYILIHPPMMFVAYALTIVPAASGIAHMVTGTDRWSVVAGRVSRIDWVLYTFAMGLGGMWAYYTLGFGGYWAWDPVEVANLLPWLALTLYLHAQMMHGRRGWFGGIGPLLAVLPFLLTVFSTVSTRSGLWVSVHAFTDPTNTFNPDAAARLLGILDVDASLLPYFGILVGLLLVTLALWCRRLAMDHEVMERPSRAIAAVLALAGGMAWATPNLFLSLVFEAGDLVGSPGLGGLALLGIATLAAASPALVKDDAGSGDGSNRTGWRRLVDVAPLAGVSVLLLSLLLVVSLMWHFAAVNGWSEAFWDARVPFLMTPVVLALTILMLRGRGKERAVAAAGGLLVAALVALAVGGTGAYAVVLATGYLLAAMDKMRTVSLVGGANDRLASVLLILAALLNLVFWVDPPSSILFGALEPRWPVHLLLIPTAVAALVGAHLVGLGRRIRWPFFLAAVLGGYYVAPGLAVAAYILHRRSDASDRPIRRARIRPVGVYGVHFALAVLLLGYAASTYYEVRDDVELAGEDGTFSIAGTDYSASLLAVNDDRPATTFHVGLGTAEGVAAGAPSSYMQWEPTTGAYRSLPGVLRLWDRDVYVSLDAVCIDPLVDGECPAGGWITANEAGGFALTDEPPSAARLTVWMLPAINLVWAALALFVVYGLPVAALVDPSTLHRPQRSKPTATDG